MQKSISFVKVFSQVVRVEFYKAFEILAHLFLFNEISGSI